MHVISVCEGLLAEGETGKVLDQESVRGLLSEELGAEKTLESLSFFQMFSAYVLFFFPSSPLPPNPRKLS